MEPDRPGKPPPDRLPSVASTRLPTEDQMAASSSARRTADTRFEANQAGDPAPDNDKISGTRADYSPTGADPKATTGGTLKRTVKEFSEDNLTDWAAALTYYGILALFPALIGLVSISGLLVDPKTLTDALTSVVPGSASDALTPVITQLASNERRPASA